jgi:TolA-binding protein
MGIRIAVCLTLALALLGLTATTSPPLSAQETSRTKIDVPRDDLDKILLEEAKRDRGRAIDHLKEKIRELEKEHDDLVYQLINLRTKLKRAVDGLAELDPVRGADTDRAGSAEEGTTQPSKENVLRPRPSPTTPRERDELLKKYADQAALAARLDAESTYMIKYLRKEIREK